MEFKYHKMLGPETFTEGKDKKPRKILNLYLRVLDIEKLLFLEINRIQKMVVLKTMV